MTTKVYILVTIKNTAESVIAFIRTSKSFGTRNIEVFDFSL